MSACCWRLRKTLSPIRDTVVFFLDSKNSTQPINAMASTPEPPSHPLPNPTPTVPTNPSGSVFLGYGNPPQFPHAGCLTWLAFKARLSQASPQLVSRPPSSPSMAHPLSPRALHRSRLVHSPSGSSPAMAPTFPGEKLSQEGPWALPPTSSSDSSFPGPPLASAPAVGLIRRCFLDPPMTLTRMCAEVTLKQPRHALCPPWSVSPTPLPPVCHGTCSPKSVSSD